MWFKNAKVYLIKPTDSEFALNSEKLNEALERAKFTPLGQMQESTFGFIESLPGAYAPAVDNCWHITAQAQDKILPASVVNEFLAEKLDEIEKAEGRRPGRKERNQMAEDIRAQLLPQAFHRTRKVQAYIDTKRALLVIDAASDSVADTFTAHLREALGSLPIVPAVGYCHTDLTAIYRGEAPTPADCQIEGELNLELKTDPTVKAKFKNLEKDSGEILQALDNGMSAVSMTMSFGDELTFLIDEGLTFKRLKFMDKLTAQADESDDPATDLMLMTDSLGRLFDSFEINADQVQG